MDTGNKSVREVIKSLDNHNRWLTKHALNSYPYTGEAKNRDDTGDYVSTYVADKWDTSPFRHPSDQLYIPTAEYMKNLKMLMRFIASTKKEKPLTETAIAH